MKKESTQLRSSQPVDERKEIAKSKELLKIYAWTFTLYRRFPLPKPYMYIPRQREMAGIDWTACTAANGLYTQPQHSIQVFNSIHSYRHVLKLIKVACTYPWPGMKVYIQFVHMRLVCGFTMRYVCCIYMEQLS